MRINHIALWTDDFELLKDFYTRYFNATPGEKYCNPVKNFTSYFLTLPDGGARLEIMNMPYIINSHGIDRTKGYCHIAISVGTRETVDALTEALRIAGVKIIDGPRTTGDGYYESVVADPDGNLVEITI